MAEFQQKVAFFVEHNGLEITVPNRVLDLTTEIGELAKEVLKGTCYGREPFSPTGNWADELGDAFFSLICVANSTGVNMEMALDQALNKYQQRLGRTRDLSSGS